MKCLKPHFKCSSRWRQRCMKWNGEEVLLKGWRQSWVLPNGTWSNLLPCRSLLKQKYYLWSYIFWIEGYSYFKHIWYYSEWTSKPGKDLYSVESPQPVHFLSSTQKERSRALEQQAAAVSTLRANKSPKCEQELLSWCGWKFHQPVAPQLVSTAAWSLGSGMKRLDLITTETSPRASSPPSREATANPESCNYTAMLKYSYQCETIHRRSLKHVKYLFEIYESDKEKQTEEKLLSPI